MKLLVLVPALLILYFLGNISQYVKARQVSLSHFLVNDNVMSQNIHHAKNSETLTFPSHVNFNVGTRRSDTSTSIQSDISSSMKTSHEFSQKKFCYVNEKVYQYYSGRLSITKLTPIQSIGNFGRFEYHMDFICTHVFHSDMDDEEHTEIFSQRDIFGDFKSIGGSSHGEETYFEIFMLTNAYSIVINRLQQYILSAEDVRRSISFTLDKKGSSSTPRQLIPKESKVSTVYACSRSMVKKSQRLLIRTYELTHNSVISFDLDMSYKFIRQFHYLDKNDAIVTSTFPQLLSRIVDLRSNALLLLFGLDIHPQTEIKSIFFHNVPGLDPISIELKPGSYLIFVKYDILSSVHLIQFIQYEYIRSTAFITPVLIQHPISGDIHLIINHVESSSPMHFNIMDNQGIISNRFESNETLAIMKYSATNETFQLQQIIAVNQSSQINGRIFGHLENLHSCDFNGNLYIVYYHDKRYSHIVKLNNEKIDWVHYLDKASFTSFKTFTLKLNDVDQYKTFYITDCKEGDDGRPYCYVALHNSTSGKEIWEQVIISKISTWQDAHYAQLKVLSSNSRGDLWMLISSFTSGYLFTGERIGRPGSSVDGFIAHMKMNCTCENPNCLVPYCFGIHSFDPSVCNGRGDCIDANQCQCLNNSYTGDMCQLKMCDGIPETDRNVCSGRGLCIDVNTCHCKGGSGQFCEQYECFGVSHSSAKVCSGNGVCEDNNFCRCNITHSGRNCEIEMVPKANKMCPPGQYFSILHHINVHHSTSVLSSIDLTQIRDATIVRENQIFFSKDHQLHYIDGTSWINYIFSSDPSVTGIDPTGNAIYIASFSLNRLLIDRIRRNDQTLYLDLRLTGKKTYLGGSFIVLNTLDIYPERESIVITGAISAANPSTISFFPDCDPFIYSGGGMEMSFLLEISSNMKQCKKLIPLARTVAPTIMRTSVIDNSLIIAYSRPMTSMILKIDAEVLWVSMTEQMITAMTTDKYGSIYLVHFYDNEQYLIRLDSQGTKRYEVQLENINFKVNQIIMSPQGYLYAISANTTLIQSLIIKFDPEKGEILSRTQIWNAYVDDMKFVKDSHIAILGHSPTGVHAKIGNHTIDSTDLDGVTPYIFLANYTEHACFPCPSGYVKMANNETCIPCESGTFKQGISCVPCEVGYFSAAASENCIPCPVGTFSNAKGSTRCEPCFIGLTFTSGADQIVCFITAVGVIGLIVLLVSSVILFIIFFIIFIKYKAMKLNQRDEIEKALIINDDSISGNMDSWRLLLDMRLSEIKFEELTHFREIKSGGSGALIFKAIWKKMPVIAKVYRLNKFVKINLERNRKSDIMHDQTFLDFEQELKFMATLHHKNIVQFYGCCLNPPKFGLILEYCQNGNLKDFISSEKNAKLLDWECKLNILRDIAMGVNFLHSRSIIHRDLKPGNILIDSHLCAKVSDFGVSKFIEENVSTEQTKIVGTSFYMAPEVIKGSYYDRKCDVFSFAIIMFEVLLCTRENPYYFTCLQDAIQNVDLRIASDPTFRPKFPQSFEIYDKQDCLLHHVGSPIPQGRQNAPNVVPQTTIKPLFSSFSSSFLTEEAKQEKQTFLSSEDFIEGKSEVTAEKNEKVYDVPIKHKHLQSKYLKLMRDCWNHEPKERPTFESIIHHLEDMLKMIYN